MQRRTKLLFVILIGLLLLGVGLYLILQPYLAERAARQPAQLPSAVKQTTGTGKTTFTPTPATSTAQTPPVSSGLLAIQNRARAVVERIGSGNSSTGFLGFQDAAGDVTANGAAELRSEQAALQAAHPSTAESFGISTRSISVRTTSGVFGDATISITVEAIQSQTTGVAQQVTSNHAKKIDLTFVKQSGGTYLVDTIAWSDIAL